MDPFYRDEENEILEALTAGGVRFVVIGGAAVQFHGVERSRDDLDILLEPSDENARRFALSIRRWMAVTPENTAALAHPNKRLPPQAPWYFDFLTSLDGIDFGEAFDAARLVRCGVASVRVLSLPHLLRTKRTRGEPKDLEDVEALERLRLDS